MTPTPRDAVIAQAIAALEKMLRLFGRPRKGEYVDGGASYKLAVETVAEAQAALASLRAIASAPADQSDAYREAAIDAVHETFCYLSKGTPAHATIETIINVSIAHTKRRLEK
jgi:hypothetical protein